MGGILRGLNEGKIGGWAKKKIIKKSLGLWSKKSWVNGKKYQMIHAKRRSWHPKTVSLKTFCPNLTFKNRYTTSKMDQLAGFLLHPHFLKLAKNRKNVEMLPHFQSAFGTAVYAYTYAHILIPLWEYKNYKKILRVNSHTYMHILPILSYFGLLMMLFIVEKTSI